MPYILPSDTRTIRLSSGVVRRPVPVPLAGQYINQRFVLPYSSLPALSGGYVAETWTRPPYRTAGLGASFLDSEAIPGIKNLYLLIAAGGLVLLSGGRRRRR